MHNLEDVTVYHLACGLLASLLLLLGVQFLSGMLLIPAILLTVGTLVYAVSQNPFESLADCATVCDWEMDYRALVEYLTYGMLADDETPEAVALHVERNADELYRVQFAQDLQDLTMLASAALRLHDDPTQGLTCTELDLAISVIDNVDVDPDVTVSTSL